MRLLASASAPTPTSATCRRWAGSRASAPRSEGRGQPLRPPDERAPQRPGHMSEAAGMPSALIKTISAGLRNETSALSARAAHDPQPEHHRLPSLRAQDGHRAAAVASHQHHAERRRARCAAARCGHLLELDALPEASLASGWSRWGSTPQSQSPRPRAQRRRPR
jgi:diacylglycerol O-acyltransferase